MPDESNKSINVGGNAKGNFSIGDNNRFGDGSGDGSTVNNIDNRYGVGNSTRVNSKQDEGNTNTKPSKTSSSSNKKSRVTFFTKLVGLLLIGIGTSIATGGDDKLLGYAILVAGIALEIIVFFS